MYFSSLDFFSSKFRSDLRNIDGGGMTVVTTVDDAGDGIEVEIEHAGCLEFFLEGVRSETCLNFKRYGNDGVRNKRNLDFFSLGIALSSKNRSAFLSFLDFSLVNGEDISVEEIKNENK
jgi:hypothetical protein